MTRYIKDAGVVACMSASFAVALPRSVAGDEPQLDEVAKVRLTALELSPLREEGPLKSSDEVLWRFGITDGDWLAGYIIMRLQPSKDGTKIEIKVSGPNAQKPDPFSAVVSKDQVPEIDSIADWVKAARTAKTRHMGRQNAQKNPQGKPLLFFEVLDSKGTYQINTWFESFEELGFEQRILAAWTYIYALGYKREKFDEKLFKVPKLFP